MKKVTVILIGLIFILNQSFAQTIPSQEKIEGLWKFVPQKKYSDTTFLAFIVCKSNKMIDIMYWKETRKSNIICSPYSYYGFWDNKNSDYPKKVTDLKVSGNRVLFYDDIGRNYDSLGNLIKHTRSCFLTYSIEGDDEAEMPSDYTPDKIYLNFTGREPDVYERIKEIPLFVIDALRNNEKDWEKYRLFVDFKKINKKVYLNTKPKQPTKMYLIKGDEVEILDEKGDWLKICYYGKKTIEGWIKRSDVE